MQKTALGRRVEVRLAEMDHSHKWLAGVLRKSPATVSRWFDGTRRLSVEDLEKIAIALHRTPGWLLGEPDAGRIEELAPLHRRTHE